MRPSHKELPPISARALSQPKDNLTNVLDVGLPLCFVCAPPLSHELAVHRQLDYGVVVCERLFVVICLAFNLAPYRFHGGVQCPNDFVVFCLAQFFRVLNQLLSLAHPVFNHIDNRLPL